MMTAMWRGSLLKSIFSSSVSSIEPGSASLLKSIIESLMLVRNVPKHQTFRRCSPARFVECRLERARESCRLQFAASDLDQRARDPANHIAKKTVRADADPDDA